MSLSISKHLKDNLNLKCLNKSKKNSVFKLYTAICISIITSLDYYESFHRCREREVSKVTQKHTENRLRAVRISGSGYDCYSVTHL